jgi:hypothetical protein
MNIKPKQADSNRIFKRTLVIVLLIFASIGIFFRVEGLLADFLPDARRSPDEKNYRRYVRQVHEEGVKGFRSSIRRFIEDPEEHIESPPSRVGYYSWVYLAGRLMSDKESFRPGVVVSVISSLVMILITFFLGRALFGLWPAALAAAFVCVSPIDMVVSHRMWQDGYLAMLTAALTWCGYRILDPGRNFGVLCGLYSAIMILGLLSKETFWLYSGCVSMGVILILLAAQKRPEAIRMGAALGVSGAVVLTVNALICGGLDQWLLSIQYFQTAHHINPWVLRNQTAGPTSILHAYTLVSPVTSLGSIIGGLFCMDRMGARMRSGRFNHWLEWFGDARTAYPAVLVSTLTLYVTVISLEGTLTNLRFVNSVLPIICLLAGHALHQIYRAMASSFSSPIAWSVLALLLISLALLSDIRTYEFYFSHHRIGDLIVQLFIDHGYKGMSKII